MHFQKTLSLKIAAAGLIGISAQQPVEPPATPPAPPRALGGSPQLPRSQADPMPALIEAARRACSQVQDYTCTFIKQERIDGKLNPAQTAKMNVRSRPFSIHVEFVSPDSVAGREAVYIASPQGSRRLKVKENGWKGALGFVALELDDRRVMAENRHTLDQAGLAALTELVAQNYRVESAVASPTIRVADYQVGDRVCTRVEMVSDPRSPNQYCHRCFVYFDKQTKLPIRFEAYDRPTPGSPAGELIEFYGYHDIRFNVGLSDEAFQK